jgi:NAD(P) transhydrogenase
MNPAAPATARTLERGHQHRAQSAAAYDLIAIGSGPAGQRAAVQAAKLGRHTAIVDHPTAFGGTSTNTGTVPSKALRAAVVELTGIAHGTERAAYRIKDRITIDDLLWRAHEVIRQERQVIDDQLSRNGVDVLPGTASFLDPHTMEITSASAIDQVRADSFVIAVGTRPTRPQGVDFDGHTVLDSDGILGLAAVPRTLTVVGAGVIGLEYASILAAVGTTVTVVDKRDRILDFVDAEVAAALQYHLRDLGVVFRLGEEVQSVKRREGGAVTELRSGKRIPSDVVLYAAGRHGATDGLNLAAIGLEADHRGNLAVGPDYRTAQPHIFAAGDVIGFPSLAATSMEQGRLAALAALSEPAHALPALLPYGIYTIPEISYVGPNEDELTRQAVPYVVGVARYRELVRGAISGDRTGMLKLVVHAGTSRVLGVHIFGTAATELIHIGQTIMAADLPLSYLVDAVFNVPTFADAYKVAALDAANRLNEIAGRTEAVSA